MANFKLTALLYPLFILTVALSCGRSKNPPAALQKAEPSVIEVTIGGMTCTGCEQKIQAGITKISGIKSVKASHIDGNAFVEYYPDLTDTSKIREAVAEAGYTVKKIDLLPAEGTK